MKYLALLIILFTIGCKKQVIECADPYAINYNQKGEEERCVYPTSLIRGKTYSLTVVHYPLQPSQEGEDFSMSIRQDLCPDFEMYHTFTASFIDGFHPYDCCFELKKDMSFTRPDSLLTSWAGGIFEFDSCRFYGNNYDSVIINGTVYNSGIPYPAVFKN